jgi:glycosyltransferase involved in cell wall biosynthesis
MTSTPDTNQIIGLFPQLLGPGGVQEAGRQTVAALTQIATRNGSSTIFLSLNDPAGMQWFDTGEGKFSFRGFGRSKWKFALSALKESGKDTRLVLAAHPHLATPAALLKWKSPQIRTVVVSHGIEVWKPLPRIRHSALVAADIILAPSTDTAKKLSEVQGLPAEKIRRLPWPLSTAFLEWADAPAQLATPRGWPQGQVILTVGRWAASERYKGADDLIRAIAQLRDATPDLQLVAAGGGDDLPRLQKLAGELGVAGRVHFLEDLSRQELAGCYARADIFALPSTGEGFGLVFLEAMAFGCPVIGAASGGTTDLVEDGVNGLLVPPRDPDRLAESLNRLLCDEPLRAVLGRQGSEIARRKYPFEVFRAGLQNILAEIGVLD